MPFLPQDQLWSPLFAEARWETEDDDGRAGENAILGIPTSPYGRVCWDRAVTIRAPLAVPPPWTGTATMTAPAGCAEAELRTEEHGLPLLAIAAPGFTLSGEIRLGKSVIHTETVTVDARDPADAGNGTFWYGEHELVRFAPGGAGINGSIFLFGDALPWLQPGDDNVYDRGLYYTFLSSTEIPVEELIRRTGATPYAAVAVIKAGSSGQFGGDGAGRARLQEALASVEVERLAPDDQRQLQWARRNLGGWPSTTPSAGRATLVVDVGTTVVEVNGRVLLARDMLAQGAAIFAKTATETKLTVDVPAGEAVMVRTVYISFAAGGGFWHGTTHEGWSALLRGGSYQVKKGELQRSAPEGTTCVSVEGAPATVKVFGSEALGDRQVGGAAGTWPRAATVHPTEPGRYVVVFDEIGATRVRYEAGGCTGG